MLVSFASFKESLPTSFLAAMFRQSLFTPKDCFQRKICFFNDIFFPGVEISRVEKHFSTLPEVVTQRSLFPSSTQTFTMILQSFTHVVKTRKMSALFTKQSPRFYSHTHVRLKQKAKPFVVWHALK